MKTLVVDGGGRGHATAWKIAQSPDVDVVYCVPGNAGTATMRKDGELRGRNIDIDPENIEGMIAFGKKEGVDLTVVGPEAPLVAGFIDEANEKGLNALGPSRLAARLEGSKVYAKEIMAEHGIPTASPFIVVSNDRELRYNVLEQGISYIRDNWENPDKLVLKADGLAAGKGVLLPETKSDAYLDLMRLMVEKEEFGKAGDKVVIEPRLYGWEASYIALTDGKSIKVLMPGQDYKPIGDGNTGENTGGMGGKFPLDELTDDMKKEIEEKIMHPTLQATENKGRPFKGVLYAGLMMTDNGPEALEYNVRFGDPEQQHQMFMMSPDVDIVPYMMACINGNLSDLPDIKWRDGYCVGVVMASNGYPGKYEKNKLITFNDTGDLDFDHFIFHAGTKLGENGNIYTSGGRVLLPVAHGRTQQEAMDNAYRLVRRISFENAYFRNDIGKLLSS